MTSLSVQIHTDGGARGNPGPAAIGYVITSGHQTLAAVGRTIGSTTNNQAEYQAIVAALEHAKKLKVTAIHLCSDSELVIKQLRGEYKVKNKELAPWFLRATSLINEIGHVTLTAVRREKNVAADALVNAALDGELGS